MHIGHSHNPWLFSLDELDRLEASFERIFVLHDTSVGKKLHEMEEEILQEHIKAEEDAEKKISQHPSKQQTKPSETRVLGNMLPWETDSTPSIKELLTSAVPTDALCVSVFNLCAPLRDWAQKRYVDDGVKDRAIFRLWVNTHVLPAKVAFAISGISEEGEDVPPHVMAAEWSLAVLYAHRIRRALASLKLTGELSKGSAFSVRAFDDIRTALLSRQELYERKSKFS